MFLSGDASPAQEHRRWDDKEFFIRKAFTEDPKRGCELLFRHYHSVLCNHAVRLVYSKEIAEDIVAEIFLTFWQRQLYLHIESSFRAYLFVAVRNKAIKYLQREFLKTVPSGHNLESDWVSSSTTPQEIMQYEELNHKIEKAISNLSPQCQKIFLMNRFDGKKYNDIAEELKISIKTVEAHISKALDVLRKAVRNEIFIFLILIILG